MTEVEVRVECARCGVDEGRTARAGNASNVAVSLVSELQAKGWKLSKRNGDSAWSCDCCLMLDEVMKQMFEDEDEVAET